MSIVKKFLTNPVIIFTKLKNSHISRLIPDKPYLKLMYRAVNGEKLNLDNPKTFTEKLNWLKLYNRNDMYTELVDKYLVRNYVSKKIGDEYLLPLLGVWDSVDDIDFEMLPEQFVVKCNHNSGTGFYLCKDKSLMNKNHVVNGLRKGLRENFYYRYREWPYKNVKRKIIAEPFMYNTNGEPLVDYKVFCFNGVPKVLQVNSNRFSEESVCTDFYDTEWNYLHIQEGGNGLYPCAGDIFEKPNFLLELLKISSILSYGIPHLRVDFNCWNNRLYFSELTFFHNAAMNPFYPSEWNDMFGSWIDIDP